MALKEEASCLYKLSIITIMLCKQTAQNSQSKQLLIFITIYAGYGCVAHVVLENTFQCFPLAVVWATGMGDKGPCDSPFPASQTRHVLILIPEHKSLIIQSHWLSQAYRHPAGQRWSLSHTGRILSSCKAKRNT